MSSCVIGDYNLHLIKLHLIPEITFFSPSCFSSYCAFIYSSPHFFLLVYKRVLIFIDYVFIEIGIIPSSITRKVTRHSRRAVQVRKDCGS